VKSLTARIDRLEQRQGRRKWPFVQVLQGGTRAEAEAELAAEVRATGWTGDIDAYPGGCRIIEFVGIDDD